MDIRTRLIALILSLLLPAFMAGVIAVCFVYAEQKDAQEKGLAEASRVLAQLIDNELENSEEFLQGLAASPALAEGNLERFYRHAKTVSHDDEKTIVLSTPEGRQILNTRVPFGSPLPPGINPRLFELRRHSGPYRTIVSDLFFSPLGQRYDFAVQIPVVIDGSVRYYMSRGTEASQLQRFLKNQGFPATWIASVVDREEVVIARSENPEKFIGKHATGSLAEKIRRTQSGINEGETLDGKPVMAFFHRAPKSEWTVILSVPKAELDRPAFHAALILTVLMLLVLAGALILTRRHLVRTLTPIRQLRDDGHRLGRGESVERHVSGITELDEVNASLVQASSRIREASADLERRVADAIESTERAQKALLQSQKLEALGRLTGGVAHDFNNVLQTLTSSLQLIRLESNPAQVPTRIAACEKAVARATALVAQLRAFGRAQEAYRETVRADQAVGSALPMLRSGLPSAIKLEASLLQAAWPITIDLTQFELALLNLVMNARDAITIIGQGVITIHVSDHTQRTANGTLPAGDYVCIEVSDTGTGMSPEILNKAFDPFFTTKPVDKGSGLGLPQAYGFATQSGGTLVLDSIEGKGTTATMYLPRAQASHLTIPSSAPGHAKASQILSGTILYVEDDKLVSDSVSPILEQSGARVLLACNSEEALAILESGERVDILFSDIVMPGKMNGVMLAKHVQTHFPEVVILLATGYVDEKIDLPGVKVLTKPYNAEDAAQVLAEAMSGKPADRHSVVAPVIPR